MKLLFSITSENELKALNRALLEAKFSGNPCDQDVPGSTYVADVATRVASQLVSANPQYQSWFALDRNRREWKAALAHAVSQRAWWQGATPQARTGMVRPLLAPFQIDESVIQGFAQDVDDVLKRGGWYSIWRAIDGAAIRLVTKRPAVECPDEIVVVAADGTTVIYRSVDEPVVTDWLLENGFEFVVDGVLSS